jgi:hypothetical protein
MADPVDTLDFVEIYHTTSTFAAQKILDVLLLPADINAIVRNRSDTPFPTSEISGGAYIAVARPHVDKAKALIEEAEEDGFLTGEDGEETEG